MTELKKLRTVMRTILIVVIIVVATLLSFPHEVKPVEWIEYVKSYGVTIGATFFGAIIGIIVGVLLAFFRFQKLRNKYLDLIKEIFIDEYIDIMRGTPMMLQLLIFSLVILKSGNSFVVACLALGLNSAAYTAEIVRSGIESIDKGQMEAARAIGMPFKMAMSEIVIPQAIKNILPALVSEFITLLKETSIIGFIGGIDLLRSASIITSQTYRGVEPLLAVGFIYLILTSIFTVFMRKVERGLKVSD